MKNYDVDRLEVARCAVEERHRVKIEDMKVIEKESNWKRRIIKEALELKVKWEQQNEVRDRNGLAFLIEYAYLISLLLFRFVFLYVLILCSRIFLPVDFGLLPSFFFFLSCCLHLARDWS